MLAASLGPLSPDFGGRLSPELQQPHYVLVNNSGRVVAVFLDDSGTKPIQDAVVNRVLRSLRFLPALRDGKPVESITPRRLDRLGLGDRRAILLMRPPYLPPRAERI